MFKNYEKKLVSRNDDDDEPDEAIEAEEDQGTYFFFREIRYSIQK